MAEASVRRPVAVAFDVVGTLFALDPLAARMRGAGLGVEALGEWFAHFLRDAMALGELPAHPDVQSAFEHLRSAGIRIMALTNGGADATGKLLERAGLEAFVERIVSIDEVQHWKPRRDVYLHAAAAMGVEPRRLALVAAHAWDICGAARAGLLTAWVPGKRRRSIPRCRRPR